MAYEKTGFTLMEVMMAVLLFALGIMTVVGALPWMISAQKAAAMQTTAGILAERQMELIMDDTNFDGLNANYNDSLSSRRDITGYSGFKSCIKVENVNPGAYGGNLKKITVIIFWRDKGIEHKFVLVNQRKR